MYRFFIALIFVSVLASCGGGAALHLPDAVQAAFLAQYPDATNVEWHEDDGNFHAYFTIRGEEISVAYAPDGTAPENE